MHARAEKMNVLNRRARPNHSDAMAVNPRRPINLGACVDKSPIEGSDWTIPGVERLDKRLKADVALGLTRNVDRIFQLPSIFLRRL